LKHRKHAIGKSGSHTTRGWPEALNSHLLCYAGRMIAPVLIVIDMQNDFLARWEPAARAALIVSINDLAAIVRRAGRPVIWIRQEFEPDLRDALPEMRLKGIRIVIKETEGCRLHAGLEVAATDRVIIKKRYSAFFGTELDGILKTLDADALIVAGINTHACIRTTVVDAYQRDWPVVLALDCIDSYDREHHEISLRYMDGKLATGMTNREIASELGT
jgi:nicotinamidase-related amidase